MAYIDTADLISISEANKAGISGLVRQAEEGREQVLLRNNKPVAAVISIEALNELQRVEEDLLDISLAAARMLATGESRHTLDDVLARFGYTRDQLREAPEQMAVRVELIDEAVADLERYAESGNLPLFLKKLIRLEEAGKDVGLPLGRGLTGWRKVVVGDRNWRIIFYHKS